MDIDYQCKSEFLFRHSLANYKWPCLWLLTVDHNETHIPQQKMANAIWNIDHTEMHCQFDF